MFLSAMDVWPNFIFQANASYLEMIDQAFEHLQEEKTWENFGLFMINNTAVATALDLIMDLGNKTIYDGSGELL